MLDVSWAELAVVLGLGLTLIGKHDLPRVSRTAGTFLGRAVGLAQGARARADVFASQNELRQLQNELRSGLRELDAVKAEVAVSVSGRGIMGRGLGAMVPGVNKQAQTALGVPSISTAAAISSSTMMAPGQLSKIEEMERMAGRLVEPATEEYQPLSSSTTRHFPPVSQTIGAVAEDEWERQGIRFQSRAEQGAGLSSSSYDVSACGSVLLANLIKQTLIFDQYDRVVQEQERVLQGKIQTIQQQQVQEKNNPKDKKE